MNKLICYLFLLFMMLELVACETTSDKNNITRKDTLDIDFPFEIDPKEVFELSKFKSKLQEVIVPFDPVYKQKKRYEGVEFKKVLAHYFDLESIKSQNIMIIFECNDHYIISMPLQKIFTHHAYLVWRDLDAPKGKRWITIKKGEETKEAAPYYLVWTDAPKTDFSFVWPYGLLNIKLIKR